MTDKTPSLYKAEERSFQARITPKERFWLWLLAIIGFVGVNGTFVWSVLVNPEIVDSALENPVALAFMGEALLLLLILPYLLNRWRVISVHWVWFVLLALIGSIVFALPAIILWNDRKQRNVGDLPPDI